MSKNRVFKIEFILADRMPTNGCRGYYIKKSNSNFKIYIDKKSLSQIDQISCSYHEFAHFITEVFIDNFVSNQCSEPSKIEGKHEGAIQIRKPSLRDEHKMIDKIENSIRKIYTKYLNDHVVSKRYIQD